MKDLQSTEARSVKFGSAPLGGGSRWRGWLMTAAFAGLALSSSRASADVSITSTQRIAPFDAPTTDINAPSRHFGMAVAIDGDTAVVGTPGETGGAGVVYVFIRSGGSWQPHPITASKKLAG